MDCSSPGFSVHGIFQARILEWVAFSSSGDLPNSEIKPESTSMQQILYHWATFLVVQLFSHVQLFATPWIAAHQASLYFTFSHSLLKLMSIELVMPSNHLILCHPILLLPSTFPSIRVFSNKSALSIRWPKYWSFSISFSPSNEYSRLISFRIDWFDLAVQRTLKSLSPTPQFKSINSLKVLSPLYGTILTSICD